MAQQDKNLDEFEREVREGLEQQQAVRLEVLGELKDTQALMQVFLQHESARLERDLGRDHPRVRSLDVAARDNLGQIRALTSEIDIGRIRVPEVAEGDALVHGRVKEAGGRGVPGLTVCLVDRANEDLAGLDPATTDRSGYYSIVIRSGASRAQSQTPKSGIFLGVFTAAGKLVHRRKQALDLAPGARLQIEVTLDRGEVFGTPDRDSLKAGRGSETTRERAETGSRDEAPDPVAAIVESLAEDSRFSEIGASTRKLGNRFTALGLDSTEAVTGLLEQDDRDVRDGLRLPNLESARTFKRILAQTLETAG